MEHWNMQQKQVTLEEKFFDPVQLWNPKEIKILSTWRIQAHSESCWTDGILS